MTEEGNGIIRLRSSDGKVFELTESAAEISELLKDSPREEDDEVTEIDIVRVASPCLEKVVEFMKHYDEEKMKEIPTPLGGSTFNEARPNSSALRHVQIDSLLFSHVTGDGSTLVPRFRLRRKNGPRYAFQYA